LKVWAEKHCYGEFLYNCETNDRNVSVTKMYQQNMTEMFQRKKSSSEETREKLPARFWHSALAEGVTN